MGNFKTNSDGDCSDDYSGACGGDYYGWRYKGARLEVNLATMPR